MPPAIVRFTRRRADIGEAVGGDVVRGMPHLYYTSGAASRPTWVGRTLIVGEDPHGVRRLYQREDALPLPPDAEPVERRQPRFSLRRIFGAAAG